MVPHNSGGPAPVPRDSEGTMTKLTPAAARDLQPGGILWDDQVKGLHLRAWAESKTFALRYRARSGINRRLKVGSYPTLTVDAARRVAKELAERIARGEDPAGEWKTERGTPTMNALCDRYLEEWAAKRLKDNSFEQHRQLIDAQIRPGLGTRRVTEIKSVDVDRFLERVFNRDFVEAKSGPKTAHWTAHHTKKLLAKLFKRVNKFFSIQLPHNPMEDTKAYGRIKRKRHATTIEMPKLAAAFDKLAEKHPRRAALFWCLFLTGGRVDEIRLLQGKKLIEKDVGGERRLFIRLTEHKTVAHIGEKDVAVPAQAAKILASLPPVKPNEPIFGPISKRRLQVIWTGIRDAAEAPGLKMLDARRTFASFALSAGLSLEIVGEMLGHTDTETTKGYAYLIDEMKHRAAETTAEAIMSAASGGK